MYGTDELLSSFLHFNIPCPSCGHAKIFNTCCFLFCICVCMYGNELESAPSTKMLLINNQLWVTLRGRRISGWYMWNVRETVAITSPEIAVIQLSRLVMPAPPCLPKTGCRTVALASSKHVSHCCWLCGRERWCHVGIMDENKGFYQTGWSKHTQWIP